MAEMYWKKSRPQKTESAKAAHAARLEGVMHAGQGESPSAAFHFDVDAARRLFDGRDRQRAGQLEIPLLLKLAEEIWASQQPHEQRLSQESKEVRTPRFIVSAVFCFIQFFVRVYCSSDLLSALCVFTSDLLPVCMVPAM
jgi:hypothetical protein